MHFWGAYSHKIIQSYEGFRTGASGTATSLETSFYSDAGIVLTIVLTDFRVRMVLRRLVIQMGLLHSEFDFRVFTGLAPVQPLTITFSSTRLRFTLAGNLMTSGETL